MGAGICLGGMASCSLTCSARVMGCGVGLADVAKANMQLTTITKDAHAIHRLLRSLRHIVSCIPFSRLSVSGTSTEVCFALVINSLYSIFF